MRGPSLRVPVSTSWGSCRGACPYRLLVHPGITTLSAHKALGSHDHQPGLSAEFKLLTHVYLLIQRAGTLFLPITTGTDYIYIYSLVFLTSLASSSNFERPFSIVLVFLLMSSCVLFSSMVVVVGKK